MSTVKERIINAHRKHPNMKLTELASTYNFSLNYTRKVLYNQRIGVTPLKSIDKNPHSLANKVYRAIKNRRCDLIQLANRFNVTPAKIEEAIEELKKSHRCVDNFGDGTIQMASTTPFDPKEEKVVINTLGSNETEFCVGFLSDMHIGSKYERIDVLNDIYDRYEKAGVENVYVSGNWIDGEKVFNKYDIYVYGIEAQVNNFIAKYPQKKNIKSFILSGDDHEGWYVQREHIDIGKYMEMKARESGRTDIFDLGYMEANISYERELGKGTVRIVHPGAGSSYAHSYKSQKYAESLQPGEKPGIVCFGHYHKFNYAYARAIHMIQPGCVQDQTPFMRKRNLESHVGGCIVWIKQNEFGIFTSVRVEWMPYFDKKFYTYYWDKKTDIDYSKDK